MTDDTKKPPLAAIILLSPVLVPMFAPLVLWRAYAITVLWRWYVEPNFHLATPRVVIVFGLLCLAALMPIRSFRPKPEAHPFSRPLLEPALALMLGWLGTLFM